MAVLVALEAAEELAALAAKVVRAVVEMQFTTVDMAAVEVTAAAAVTVAMEAEAATVATVATAAKPKKLQHE